MFSFVFSVKKLLHCKFHAIWICIAWWCGLLAGCAMSDCFLGSICLMVPGACTGGVSLWCLIITNTLPLFIAYLCYSSKMQLLVLPLLFVKGVSYAICSIGVFAVFGSASWLVQSLLLFTDHFGIFLLIVFSFRNCNYPEKSDMKRDALIIFPLLLIAIVVDYLYFAPLLMRLI